MKKSLDHMKILGLGYTQHECSVALVIDGVLRTAIARERVSRIKRDGSAWGSATLDLSSAINYCLEANQIRLQEIDLVVYNDYFHRPKQDFLALIESEAGRSVFELPTIALPHHFAHACCSFYLSPFDEAAIFVTDGAGGPADLIPINCDGPEAEQIKSGATVIQNTDEPPNGSSSEYESFYTFSHGEWHALRKVVGSCNGIGGAYSRASTLLFGDELDSGKTMGLSSYGKPARTNMFLTQSGPSELPVYRGQVPAILQELEEQITTILNTTTDSAMYDHPVLQHYATSLQKETEDALVFYAKWLRTNSGMNNMCLSGGVALNCVANSRIWDESGFDQIFVPPCPGDDGIALGCALYGAALHGELAQHGIPVFGGISYHHDSEELEVLGVKRVFQDESVYEACARELANGAVIAWFQEGSEFGPRALGHRSFLADPRRVDMRDHLNYVVKRREGFRPFAPVVLEENVTDYFERHYPSHCMSFVSRVRDEVQHKLPAITHVDGTARYQVLRQADNPQLYSLIRAFEQATGIPIILNTSLNRAGEPLVETPKQAAICAIESSADILVVDGKIYRTSPA